jgi:hypothetical protein
MALLTKAKNPPNPALFWAIPKVAHIGILRPVHF